MSRKLEGKVAVITGGNSGIGQATGETISRGRKEQLDQAVKEIGRNVNPGQGDVAKSADLDRLYEIVKTKTSRIDILFANAGAAEFAPLGSITEEHSTRYSTRMSEDCCSRCRKLYR